jgi:hypothetical protein
MSSSTFILTQLIGRLREHYVGTAPTYQQAHKAVVECRIPATMINGRWQLQDPDLPVIAAYFKMRPKVPPAPRAKAKAA